MTKLQLSEEQKYANACELAKLKEEFLDELKTEVAQSDRNHKKPIPDFDEMEHKLNGLNFYFLEKLITGEFELMDKNKFTAILKIRQYIFEVWIAKPIDLNCYEIGFIKHKVILNFSVLNKDDKNIIYNNIINKHIAKTALDNEEKEFEYLLNIDN